MKIVLLSSSYPSDVNPLFGPLAPVYARELVRQGHRVHILIPRSAGTPVPVKGAVLHEYGPAGLGKSFAHHSLLNPRDMLRAFRFVRDGTRALLRLCREENPDLCLSLWALPSGWYCLKAKEKLRVPYAVICLGSDIHTWANYPVIGGIIRKVLKKADRIYADGFALGKKAERIADKPCPYFPSTTAGGERRSVKPDNAPRPYTFLFAGRLEKVKGADLIVPAFVSCLRRTSLPVRLTIAGDGSLMPLLKRQAALPGLEGKIVFTGRLSPAQTGLEMKKSRCLVVPSRRESLPMVFSEALIRGMRIIVSDADGSDMADLIRKHRIGGLAAKGSVQSLSSVMSAFASGQEIHSEKGLRSVLSLFDIPSACRGLVRSFSGIRRPQRGID